MYFLGVFVVKDKIFINSIIIGVYFPGFNTNNINYKNNIYQCPFQLTPLFLACWAKKPEAALILLEEGADPNILALQV